MLSAHIEKNPKTANEKLKTQLISYGNTTSYIDGAFGGVGFGLFARLISLPIGVTVAVVQYVSTPTYRKTFPVVAILIRIKNRLEAEQKLKEEN
jgi:hypothetical protein